MSKFLELLESHNPELTGDPKWKLIDFLKSKGIKVSLVKNSDMLYIDTGESTIAVSISPEEDGENLDTSSDDYGIDKDVEGLADKDATGLKGNAQKVWGTPARSATGAVKQRVQISNQAIDAYKKGTDKIKKGIQSMNSSRYKPTI